MLYLAIIFLSCKNEMKEPTDGKLTIATVGNFSKNCLHQTNLTYETLLPLEEIQKILMLNLEKVVVNANNRKDEYGSVYYIWPSDRPDRPNPIIAHLTTPDNNSIGIAGLYAYHESLQSSQIIDSFEMGYKQLWEGKTDSLFTPHEQKVENKANLFKSVSDLGQSAFWKFNSQNGGELVVLLGNEKFSIYTKISHDADENLLLAKKLAQIVIDKCR